MAKKVYIGVNNVARKVKKIYIGVGNVARKVKKGYIGVGGVARPFWTGGEVTYYGTATALSSARSSMASSTVGNFALFAGGYTGSAKNTVDRYSTSLVRGNPLALSGNRYEMAAAKNPSYAMFAGGTNGSTDYSTYDAYNSSLTKTSGNIGTSNRGCSGGSIGNYALFAGGLRSTVEAYDTSLTKTNPTALSQSNNYMGSVTLDSNVIFACGYKSYTDTVFIANAYSTSLVRTVLTPPVGRFIDPASTRAGNYALFSAGTGASTTTVQVYDSSLTKRSNVTLSTSRTRIGAASIGGFGIFAGGWDTSTYYNIVDVFDESLTRTIGTPLSAARYNLSGETIGNYALFAGGQISNGYSDVVDAYTV